MGTYWGKKVQGDTSYIGAAKRQFKEETGLSLNNVALSYFTLKKMHRAYVVVVVEVNTDLEVISEDVNSNLKNINNYLLEEDYLHQELATTSVVSHQYIHCYLGKFNSKNIDHKTYYLKSDSTTYSLQKPDGKFSTSYKHIPDMNEDKLFQEKLRKKDKVGRYQSLKDKDAESSYFWRLSQYYDRNHDKQNIAWYGHMAAYICLLATGEIKRTVQNVF